MLPQLWPCLQVAFDAELPDPVACCQNSDLVLLLLQIIVATPRGRAWNQYSPSFGSTMNAAFLATVYANYISPGGGSAGAKAKRYECWAETQVWSLQPAQLQNMYSS